MNNICFVAEGPAEIDMLKSSASKNIVSFDTKNGNNIEALIKKTKIWNPKLFIWILELLIEVSGGDSSPKWINVKAYYFSKTKKGFIFLKDNSSPV